MFSSVSSKHSQKRMGAPDLLRVALGVYFSKTHHLPSGEPLTMKAGGSPASKTTFRATFRHFALPGRHEAEGPGLGGQLREAAGHGELGEGDTGGFPSLGGSPCFVSTPRSVLVQETSRMLRQRAKGLFCRCGPKPGIRPHLLAGPRLQRIFSNNSIARLGDLLVQPNFHRVGNTCHSIT